MRGSESGNWGLWTELLEQCGTKWTVVGSYGTGLDFKGPGQALLNGPHGTMWKLLGQCGTLCNWVRKRLGTLGYKVTNLGIVEFECRDLPAHYSENQK